MHLLPSVPLRELRRAVSPTPAGQNDLETTADQRSRLIPTKFGRRNSRLAAVPDGSIRQRCHRPTRSEWRGQTLAAPESTPPWLPRRDHHRQGTPRVRSALAGHARYTPERGCIQEHLITADAPRPPFLLNDSIMWSIATRISPGPTGLTLQYYVAPPQIATYPIAVGKTAHEAR